jgi:hypothetical protein
MRQQTYKSLYTMSSQFISPVLMSFQGNVAVVDDHSSDIKYSDYGWSDERKGEWFISYPGRDFQSTSTWGKETGATANFTFTGLLLCSYLGLEAKPTLGTSVSVYGTLNQMGETANMTFIIDDGEATEVDVRNNPSNGIIWQMQLYSSGTLSAGLHTLRMTQNTHLDVWGSIFLDYITYTPTEDTSRNGLRYLVDDRDGRIKYGEHWVPQDSPIDFSGHTATQSRVSGSSFQFDFEGKHTNYGL